MFSEVRHREWADPRIELLFGQFGGESLAAALPKVSHHVVENASAGTRIVRWVRQGNVCYPQFRVRGGPRERMVSASNCLTDSTDSAVILGFSERVPAVRSDRNPGRTPRECPITFRRRRPYHETHIPSFENPPRSRPWLPRTHENSGWPRGHQCTALQGAQATLCLTAFVGVTQAAAARVTVHRLHRASDYKRVLARAPAAVNRHFAVHGPASPLGRDFGLGSGKELSTGDAQAFPLSVDKPRPLNPDSGTCQAVWLGMVVPKRFARDSVTRSLMKRQIRVGMRRHAAHIPAGVWVIRLRAAFDPVKYISAASTGLRAAVRNEVETLLASIHRVPEAAAPHCESPS